MRMRLRLAAALVVTTATVAAAGAAFAAAASPVTLKDPRGDFRLLDGRPGARSASIDIESARWARSRKALQASAVIRELRPDDVVQYAVFRATDPATGRRYLVQASTVTTVAHVAAGSWADEVYCPRATTRTATRPDGTGRIVATVPLRCLGTPRKLQELSVHTIARSYYLGRYYSDDVARTKKPLRLR